MFEKRMENLKKKLSNSNVQIALITDEDNIYYFTGYYDYLYMNFGRPTILIVSIENGTYLITPSLEKHMAIDRAAVDNFIFWNDGEGEEWRESLSKILKNNNIVGYELNYMPPIVQRYISTILNKEKIFDVSNIISELRMIKSPQELKLARHCGEVANAMMNAGRDSIRNGIREFEVAIAASIAGTYKASELLKKYYRDSKMSPNIHFLQIMASGENISMPHHRASNRLMKEGDPVFLCFCGMTNFHRFKLGFDRMFWIGKIENKRHEKVYKVALKSQKAALKKLKPGVMAEEIHAAYAEVILKEGFDYPFRCGRATGFSFLEKPQIVYGDKTIIQPGMVFAIDGSVTLDKTFRAQVGDSFIVTPKGYEAITSHPKEIENIIV